MPRLLLLFLLVFYISTNTSNGANINHPNFSAVFFFGDSTLDTGNNDYFPTVFRSNHFPYGQDFVGHAATGRFSNGLLVPDLLSSKLGIKRLSPPFLDPKLSEDDVRTGVNFASAGSGFDDMTSVLWNTVPIRRQLEMFKSYLARLQGMAGEEAARIVGKALVFISAGTNDFILNYYDIPARKGTFKMSEYQDFLLHKVQGALKDIYDLGGRRFCIVGLPPVGCIPLQITASFNNSKYRACVDEQNSDASIYNLKLQKLLDKMQSLLSRSKFVYMDLYDFTMEILDNPAKYGFEETRRGCCGSGLIEIGPLCNILTPVCQNASSFAFFDAVHPSERLYELVTANIMERVIPQLE